MRLKRFNESSEADDIVEQIKECFLNITDKYPLDVIFEIDDDDDDYEGYGDDYDDDRIGHKSSKKPKKEYYIRLELVDKHVDEVNDDTLEDIEKSSKKMFLMGDLLNMTRISLNNLKPIFNAFNYQYNSDRINITLFNTKEVVTKDELFEYELNEDDDSEISLVYDYKLLKTFLKKEFNLTLVGDVYHEEDLLIIEVKENIIPEDLMDRWESDDEEEFDEYGLGLNRPSYIKDFIKNDDTTQKIEKVFKSFKIPENFITMIQKGKKGRKSKVVKQIDTFDRVIFNSNDISLVITDKVNIYYSNN